MKPQHVCEVGEAPEGQGHEKVPGAADQPGAESGWAKTLSVPYRCPPSGQGVLAQGSARAGQALWFGKGRASHQRIPLSSARTCTSHMESQFWVPRQSPWLSGRSSPKAASRTCFCLARAVRAMPSFPQGCPQWRDGPCSRGKHHPFLEIVTRGAASAALDAASCSQRRSCIFPSVLDAAPAF